MWLLNASTLKLEAFEGDGLPLYAILSHTWEQEEVTYVDMQENPKAAELKAGYSKLKHSCRLALDHDPPLQYVWIDTCCIEKRSSAELSEAINSMYRYYQKSRVCFVYLSDYTSSGELDGPSLRKCRWFTRGWTLQELIAPIQASFYNRDWAWIGSKLFESGTPNLRFLNKLSEATGIPVPPLAVPAEVISYSIAQRMSWAAKRTTKRPEDMAYSLMGLFRVHMSVLYGEGAQNAFRRLQLEIMGRSDDQSLFAWTGRFLSSGLLARSPSRFEDSNGIIGINESWKQPYRLTNMGISIRLLLQDTEAFGTYAALNCYKENGDRIYIYLEKYFADESPSYVRIPQKDHDCVISAGYADWDKSKDPKWTSKHQKDIYVVEQDLFI